MKKNHAIDKSGEDPTECDMCGFRNGGHMADCPAAKQTEHAPDCDGWGSVVGGPLGNACPGCAPVPHGAPRDYSPFAKMGARMTRDDHNRNALTLAYLKATERRFTGAAPTGFGAL